MKKLDKSIKDRVLSALQKLEAAPRHQGTRKLKGFENQFRARVGDYRVLYEVDDSKKLVHVYRIAHRKEAYR